MALYDIYSKFQVFTPCLGYTTFVTDITDDHCLSP